MCHHSHPTQSTRPASNRQPTALVLAVLGAASCALQTQGEGQRTELPPISPNRPTFSDGTTLIPLGHAQLETGYTFTDRKQDGVETQRQNAPEVTARYRVLDTLEARVLWGGYAWSETDAGGASSHADGGSDLALAAVIPIADQDGWRPAFAVEVLSTLGIGDEDFSSGHADPTAKLLWSYGGGHLPDWLGIGGNLNASFPTESGDRFTQTAASVYATVTPVDSDTSGFGEWYVVTPYANNLDAAHSADFGVVQRLSRYTAIDARVGFGLNDAADDFFTGFGFSIFF